MEIKRGRQAALTRIAGRFSKGRACAASSTHGRLPGSLEKRQIYRLVNRLFFFCLRRLQEFLLYCGQNFKLSDCCYREKLNEGCLIGFPSILTSSDSLFFGVGLGVGILLRQL